MLCNTMDCVDDNVKYSYSSFFVLRRTTSDITYRGGKPDCGKLEKISRDHFRTRFVTRLYFQKLVAKDESRSKLDWLQERKSFCPILNTPI